MIQIKVKLIVFKLTITIKDHNFYFFKNHASLDHSKSSLYCVLFVTSSNPHNQPSSRPERHQRYQSHYDLRCDPWPQCHCQVNTSVLLSLHQYLNFELITSPSVYPPAILDLCLNFSFLPSPSSLHLWLIVIHSMLAVLYYTQSHKMLIQLSPADWFDREKQMNM